MDCGCSASDIAAIAVINGNGIAICTEIGKDSGKKSIWNIGCDSNSNGEIDDDEISLLEISMGNKNCDLGEVLNCDQTEPVSDCPTLVELEEANPDATFTCVDGSGNNEHISCSIDGKTSEKTAKSSKLLKWAISDDCLGKQVQFI